MTHRISLRTLIAILGFASLTQACVPLIVAGVGAGVTTTVDRRTYGAQLMDTEIELKFNRQFPLKLEERTNASATAYNRYVLITGQAIDAAARAEVEAVARGIPNVREVFNELSLGYPASFSSRSNDVLLTSKVKARLFDSPYVSGHHVKVTSESGVVYLMGMLTEGESKAASEAARMVSGVKKVVSVAEVITSEQARQLNALQEQTPTQSSPR